MAEALYLLTKEVHTGQSTIQGVTAVLINKDDGQTDAQIRASAVAQLNARFPTGSDENTFPSTYFDLVTPLKVSDLSAGPLKDNLDMYVFRPSGVEKVEG